MISTTKAHINSKSRNVGIDVGKADLDVFVFELEKHFKAENTKDGIKRLLVKLNRYKLTRILVEATGGYERQLVEACAEKICLSSWFNLSKLGNL